MKQLRYWSFLPAFCLLALPLFGQNSLQLGSAVAEFGADAEISITVGSESEVQGLVAVVEISGGTAKDLVVGEVLEGLTFLIVLDHCSASFFTRATTERLSDLKTGTLSPQTLHQRK